jgi:hypothetical protein
MVHNTQNFWFCGLYPSHGVLNIREHNISKDGFFPSSGEGMETPTRLGSLERANLNHWTIQVC